jgi:hypothetical protein
MGYDIEMVTTPSTPIAGYSPQYRGRPEYIRFADMSMPYMVEIMRDAGVLDDASEHPPFPDCPPGGLDEDRTVELLDHFDEGEEIELPPRVKETRIMRAFLAARDQIERTASKRRGKVPTFKFQSNNNWLVFPKECLVIADGLTRYADANEGRSDLDVVWSGVRQWASYNRVAASHGGYRVN